MSIHEQFAGLILELLGRRPRRSGVFSRPQLQVALPRGRHGGLPCAARCVRDAAAGRVPCLRCVCRLSLHPRASDPLVLGGLRGGRVDIEEVLLARVPRGVVRGAVQREPLQRQVFFLQAGIGSLQFLGRRAGLFELTLQVAEADVPTRGAAPARREAAPGRWARSSGM